MGGLLSSSNPELMSSLVDDLDDALGAPEIDISSQAAGSGLGDVFMRAAAAPAPPESEEADFLLSGEGIVERMIAQVKIMQRSYGDDPSGRHWQTEPVNIMLRDVVGPDSGPVDDLSN